MIDLDKGSIKFLKNGVDLGTAFTINKQLLNSAFFPAVVLKVHRLALTCLLVKCPSLQNAEMAFNFGEKPFKHGLPDGYSAINSAPKEKVVINSNGDTASQAAVKPANNTPQAVIIEVELLLWIGAECGN